LLKGFKNADELLKGFKDVEQWIKEMQPNILSLYSVIQNLHLNLVSLENFSRSLPVNMSLLLQPITIRFSDFASLFLSEESSLVYVLDSIQFSLDKHLQLNFSAGNWDSKEQVLNIIDSCDLKAESELVSILKKGVTSICYHTTRLNSEFPVFWKSEDILSVQVSCYILLMFMCCKRAETLIAQKFQSYALPVQSTLHPFNESTIVDCEERVNNLKSKMINAKKKWEKEMKETTLQINQSRGELSERVMHT
jgi:hypothetical protein